MKSPRKMVAMTRVLATLVCLLGLSSSTALAYSFSVSTLSCTGVLSSGIGETINIGCSGDLVFSQGEIRAAEKLIFHADGLLSFNDVLLEAPEIRITAHDFSAQIFGGSIPAGNLSFGSGSHGTGPILGGGDITLSVPEPENWAFLVAGLGLLASFRRNAKLATRNNRSS